MRRSAPLPCKRVHRLILFDIDGTLMSAGSAAARAFHRGLLEVFGTAGPIEGHSFAGKTDPQIALELLTAAGLDRDDITARFPALWEAYLTDLPDELTRSRIRVFAGVTALLERIERRANDTALGLLTGNIEPGARLKLDAAGIGFGRFTVGAFGSDHAERPELPAVAVHRAERRFGHRFAGKDIVVIGDTPYDIACGESLGVRTIAVATGSYPADELAACGPDHLFESLEETDAVWSAIFSE
jgi:phosphoglycolate phosphatase